MFQIVTRKTRKPRFNYGIHAAHCVPAQCCAFFLLITQLYDLKRNILPKKQNDEPKKVSLENIACNRWDG